MADLAVSGKIIKNRYDPAGATFTQQHVSRGDTFFDIGTNIGFYSMMAASIVGKEGQVIGFEPLTFLYEAAKRSTEENGFTHCKIHNVALSGERGTAKLEYLPNSRNWGGAYLTSDDRTPLAGHTVVDVPTAPLSDFTEGLKANFIKIDVEGAEYRILQSSLDYIREHKPIIMSEIHKSQLLKVSNVTAEEYISLLTNLGYRCQEIHYDGSLGSTVTGNEDFLIKNVAFVYDK